MPLDLKKGRDIRWTFGHKTTSRRKSALSSTRCCPRSAWATRSRHFAQSFRQSRCASRRPRNSRCFRHCRSDRPAGGRAGRRARARPRQCRCSCNSRRVELVGCMRSNALALRRFQCSIRSPNNWLEGSLTRHLLADDNHRACVIIIPDYELSSASKLEYKTRTCGCSAGLSDGAQQGPISEGPQ
jgi:hypothetical protein